MKKLSKPLVRLLIHVLLVTSSIVVMAQNKDTLYGEQDLDFFSCGKKLSGKLITPKNSFRSKLPVIVFVHGSGPEDYSSSDNYRYLWEKFTKIGFACYSWDRAGVGESEGKWYEQSVSDRAEETIDAITNLKTLDLVDSAKIGLWGISQAGWVIPNVVRKIRPAFVIAVSCPVTTAFDQELYRVKSEMNQEGFSKNDIRQAVSYNKKLRILIRGNHPYNSFSLLQEQTKETRWADKVIRGNEMIYNYLKIVFTEDERPNLHKLKSPVLAMWGANDLVVPPRKSAHAYAKQLRRSGNNNFVIKIVPNADHTLTWNETGNRANTHNRRDKYKDDPAKIFAPGYVSMMVRWLEELALLTPGR